MTESKETGIIIRDMTGHEIGKWSPEMAETIKNTVAKEATNEELILFAQVCTESGLNPFMKEIWFVKYKDKAPAIMTARDGYLKIANMDPAFLGVQGFAVYENDVFRVKSSKGKVVDIIHEFTHKDRGVIKGAWAVAEKEGKRPVYTYVIFEEFIQYKRNGHATKFWTNKQDTMIKKVAEADVLKRICGITGLNVAETMPEEYSEGFIDVDYAIKDDEDSPNDDLSSIATSMQKEPEKPKKEVKIDELAEKNYETIKKALKTTKKDLTIENVEQKAKWFAKNKNHVQFDEGMVLRVLKIAEKELKIEKKPETTATVDSEEGVFEAEYTKKEAETVISKEDVETPEKVYERAIVRLKAKSFAKTIRNVKIQAVNLLESAGVDIEEDFMNSVVELAMLDGAK